MLVGVFVIGWGFGLYYLFKTKNWDALTRPAAAGDLRAGHHAGRAQHQRQLRRLPEPARRRRNAVLLIGTVLPALSGVMLWIGRQNPARMWAAEQLTRGRVFAHAVSASIVDGVSGGAAMAAVGVLADWAALQVAGFEPSISRELNIVDAGFGSMIGDTLSGSAFIVLGVAFVVEAFDRFRVNPMVSTIVVAIAAGVVCRIGSGSDAAGACARRRHGPWQRRSSCAVPPARIPGGVDAGLRRAADDGDGVRSLDDPDLLRASQHALPWWW